MDALDPWQGLATTFRRSDRAADGARFSTLREAVAYLARTVRKSELSMPAVTRAAEMLTSAAERNMVGHFLVRWPSRRINRHPQLLKRQLRPTSRPLQVRSATAPETTLSVAASIGDDSHSGPKPQLCGHQFLHYCAPRKRRGPRARYRVRKKSKIVGWRTKSSKWRRVSVNSH